MIIKSRKNQLIYSIGLHTLSFYLETFLTKAYFINKTSLKIKLKNKMALYN